MTVNVTKVRNANYYLDSACAHAHSGPADYYGAAGGEPAGQWTLAAEKLLGLSGEVDPAHFRTLVDKLENPFTKERLGKRPQKASTSDERVEKWVAKHPLATEEEVAAYRVKTEADVRHAVHAWDVTFSPPKSWSVLHAALERAGRHAEAERLWDALIAGVNAALAQAAAEHGWTRTGVAGPKVNGHVTTTHLAAPDLIAAIFRHHTSRDGDPQLHVHAAVMNRVLGHDGVWRTLDARPLIHNKKQLDATFLRVAEATAAELLADTLPLRFAMTPDGKAREVVGVSENVRDLFSSRTRALNERAQELVDAYTARYGVAPNPLRRWQMRQFSTLASRKAKPKTPPTREEYLDQWEAQVAGEAERSLGGVLRGVAAAAREPAPSTAFDVDGVLGQAVAEVSATKATFSRSDLYHAISNRLPDMLAIEPARIPAVLTTMTDRAIAQREVVPISPAFRGTFVPASADDARSTFDAPHATRYTTATQLAREESLVERLAHLGAPVVTEAAARAALAGSDLSAEQERVAVAILTSGLAVETLVAPAGAGKTRTVAAISAANEALTGAGVVGLTVSQNGAEVMASEGVDRAFNTAAFLTFDERDREGKASELEQATYAIPAGGRVVIDEASMVDTRTAVAVVEAVERRGAGQVIFVGDPEQTDAVDASGAFAMLVGERGDEVRELTEVRRFVNEWEAEASKGLRRGDPEAVRQYDARNRVRGGLDHEKVRDEAATAFVTDHLSGRRSIVVVGTEDEAGDMASRVREQLVGHGHVDREGVVLASGRTSAGVGDLVATRHNDRQLEDGAVFNRELWQVVATNTLGELTVRRDYGLDETGEQAWGEPRRLPAEYVSRYVDLAYAGTTEAVQGRTTDTSHPLIGRTTDRAHAYVGMGRGRESNVAHVLLEEGETPAGRLAAVLEVTQHAPAARVAMAAEAERSRDLGNLGPQWQTLVTEDRAKNHQAAVRGALGEDAEAVLADRASGGLLRLLRTAELSGHDPNEVLERAHAQGSLTGTRSPASALYARVDDELSAMPRGQHRVAFTYAQRTPTATDERMIRAHELAHDMDARVTELGRRAVEAPEPWALLRYGERASDPEQRVELGGALGVVEAFRERHGWRDPEDAIGPQPTRSEPEKFWEWSRAADVLGMDPREREMAGLSRGELDNRVQQWEREQTWMPRHVDPELQAAHADREAAERAAVAARAANEAAEAHEAEREAAAERVAAYEEVARVREAALAETRATQVAADRARLEIERREEMGRARAGEQEIVLEPEPGVEPEPDEVEPEEVVLDEPEQATEPSDPELVEPEEATTDEPESDPGPDPAEVMRADVERAAAAAAVLEERAAERAEPEPDAPDLDAPEPELAPEPEMADF